MPRSIAFTHLIPVRQSRSSKIAAFGASCSDKRPSQRPTHTPVCCAPRGRARGSAVIRRVAFGNALLYHGQPFRKCVWLWRVQGDEQRGSRRRRYIAWAKHVASLVVLGAVAWLLWAQARRHWNSISRFHVELSAPELAASFVLCLVAFLLETGVWQRALNVAMGRREVSFADSIAMNNTSNLLKYLPGRVWSYGAQMVWLGTRGVSKGRVLYVNAICLLISMLVSTALGGAYLIVYAAPRGSGWLAWPLLLVALIAGILVGPRVLVASLGFVRRLMKADIEVTATPPAELLAFGSVYVVVWLLVGIAGYCAALGVGLSVSIHDVTGITASMSVAWVVGYLSAVSPGGLGVREGLMSLMLVRISRPETALILPIVSRLLYLAVEVLLGLIGTAIGLRQGLFTTGLRGRGAQREADQ